MKTVLLAFSFFLFTISLQAQSIHLGVSGGLSNYLGDLVDKPYDFRQTNGAIGITAHYELTEKLLLRGAFTFGKVNGADFYSDNDSLKARNLSFESSISEFSVVGEYYLFSLYEKRFSPYVFGGLALFHFSPYTYDAKGDQIHLQKLGTEGQGLPGYDANPYKLTQVAVPFGGGIKYALTDNIRIGAELGLRKLFTDYLDDVSTVYADQNDLLNGRGPLAVELAYRGDELANGNPYPAAGSQRGGAKYNDWYYFTGLNISFRLGGGGSGRLGGKKGMGCPSNPM